MPKVPKVPKVNNGYFYLNSHLTSKQAMLKLTIILTGLLSVGSLFAGDPDLLLKISTNGHYFVDKNNNPVFWQGDTEWELFRCLSSSEAESLLIERKKQGFNFIQVMVAGVFPEWGESKGMKAWNTLPAWQNNNPLTPEDNYFERVDSIVDIADQLGIVLVIGVFHARDCDAGRISVQNVRPWAAWLANRLRNKHNIIYSMYPHAVDSSIPIIKNAIQGIMDVDGGNHLITMHPDPSPASSSFLHSEAWLSFNTLQTWSTDMRNYDMVLHDYGRSPAKPIINGEARYEEEDMTSAFEVRRTGYWSVLAGGFYTYGHRDNWNSPQTWKHWYATPGVLQIKIMGDFFRSLAWWKMIPDTSIIQNPKNGNIAARSAGGDWIVAYLTNKEPVIVNLNYLTVPGSITGWWINPLTGDRIRNGSYTSSKASAFKIPEGWEDAVLLLEKQR